MSGPRSWSERRVLLTGGTGLLGSHLVEALLARGASVVCLVRDWVPRARVLEEGWIDRVMQVRGELEDHTTLLRALNEHEIDVVLHAGAQAIVGTALRSPLSTFESNVRGTWNLLEACRLAGGAVQAIVIASSDKVYGASAVLPCTEDMPLLGRHPYDASKVAVEAVARSYVHTFGLPIAIARCANLYGPFDVNWNRLVPGTIRSALRGERPVVRSDGRFVREWLHASDGAEAFLRLAERVSEAGVVGEAFNFGTERGIPVLDVVRTILRLVGCPDLEPRVLGEAKDEIREQRLDARKARERLDWRATIELEDGLARTIPWYRPRTAPGA